MTTSDDHLTGSDESVPRSAPGRDRLTRLSRRTFLKGAGAAGAATLAGPLLSKDWAFARDLGSRRTPIEHVLIDCQENRSFDHYFGYAPWIASYGPPPGYSQPGGSSGPVEPYHFRRLSTPDVGHSWTDAHHQWHQGEMDGFYTTDGIWAMGYYTARELPFYYSLFDEFTLCGNYFCSLLGPTWPNRFYLAAGTSGGITTNGIWGYGVFHYPIILDLLEAAGVSWKVYNIGWDNVRGAIPTTSSSSGSDGRTTLGLAPGRTTTSTTWSETGCRRSRSSSPATRADGTNTRRQTSRSEWGFRRSSSRRCAGPRRGRIRVHPHVRRARRLLRSRGTAGARRVRSRHPGPDLGDLPVCEALPYRGNGLRAHVDVEVPGERLRPPHPRVGEPQVRRVDSLPARTTRPRRMAYGPPAPPRDRLDSIGDLTECFAF